MLKSATFGFIEGENNVLYFDCISQIETTGVLDFQKYKWRLSTSWKVIEPPAPETQESYIAKVLYQKDNCEA